MNHFVYYVIILNLISFITYWLSVIIRQNSIKNLLYYLVVILTIIGGAGGALVNLLLFDRRSEKERLMLRVLILCMFMIQLLVVLIWREFQHQQLTFGLIDYLIQQNRLLYYLGFMNVATMILFAVDKKAALKKQQRIPNAILLGSSFIGGAIGSLLAMYFFRHKVKKNYYTIGIPLMIIMQSLGILYWMNR